MSHQRRVYVVDGGFEGRRLVTAQLGAIGAEAWPFASAAEFLKLVDHLMPGCILIDVGLASGGLAALAELCRREIGWPTIALSEDGDLDVAIDAMKRGAIDYLRKPVGTLQLAAALDPAWSVLERAVEAGQARRLAQERVARLTGREFSVLLALIAGPANKVVAHRFGISVRTVEMHRSHIMAKLGVRSLSEATLLVTQAGIDIAAALAEAVQPPPAALLAGPRGEARAPAA